MLLVLAAAVVVGARVRRVESESEGVKVVGLSWGDKVVVKGCW